MPYMVLKKSRVNHAHPENPVILSNEISSPPQAWQITQAPLFFDAKK
jgi:hypothetical protein